jgi:DNA-directed RNA polymerase specialized sigma subunit
VFHSFYINEKTCILPFNEKLIKIDEEMNISESTVRRYEADMIAELSVELFGIGAFKLLK